MGWQDEIKEAPVEQVLEALTPVLSKEGLLDGLLRATENMGDNRLFTQSAINTKIIPTRLRGKEEELGNLKTQLEAKLAELSAIQARATELEESATRGNSEAERAVGELKATHTKAVEEMKRRLAEAQTEREKAVLAHKTTVMDRELRDALVAAGAADTTLRHAASIAAQEIPGLQIVDTGGRFELACVDATLNEKRNLGEVLKTWLEANPHFKRAAPAGGGAPSAVHGGNGATQPDFSRLSPREQISAAMKAGFKL